MKKTTITISEETKKKLASLGGKGETFQDIVDRVLEHTTRICSPNTTTEEETEEQNEDFKSRKEE